MRSCTLCILLILTYAQSNKQDRQCKYNIRLNHVHANIFVVESDNITHSECVFVALFIQNALHMHHIVICSLFSSSVTIFEVGGGSNFT